MNRSTANKLQNNPHYRMSLKQIEEAEKLKKPMIHFEPTKTHINDFDRQTGLHQTIVTGKKDHNAKA